MARPDAQVIENYYKFHKKGDPHTFEFQDLGHVREYARTRPEPKWLLKDMIAPDSFVLMSGPPKLGMKTWTAFQMALCIASGKRTAMFEPGQPTPVCFIEQEGSLKETLGRFDMIEKGSGISVDALIDQGLFKFCHREQADFTNEMWVEKTADQIKKYGIKFLVIDTLAKSMRGDENSAADMGIVLKSFDILRDANSTTVMVLHHLRKPPMQRFGEEAFVEDIDNDMRGSTALPGSYDAHFGIRRRLGTQQDWLDVTLRSKDDDDKHYTLEWHIDKESGIAVPSMEHVPAGGFSRVQMHMLRRELDADRRYTIAELQKAWKMASYGDAKDTADKLVEEFMLVREADGKYRLEG